MIKLRNLNFENHPEITENVLYLSKSEISRMNRDESENVTYITMKNNDFPSYNVVETPEEILAMPDIETSEKVIDWEQRRYELIRDFISARLIHKEDKLNYKEFIELHDLADIVIDNLKKNTRQ